MADVEERFEKRFSREKRIKRFKGSSILTSLLLVFMIIAANTNMAWAENIRRIPVLKEFLTVMEFSKDYEDNLEELGIVSDNGEYQISLQYGISDEKKISLYFQASENITLDNYDRMKLENLKIFDLKTKEDYSAYFDNHSFKLAENSYFSLSGWLAPGNNERFPDRLGIEFTAVINRGVEGMGSGEDFYKIISTESLGEFSFVTKLEKMMPRPKNDINKNINLLGNNMILRSLETSDLSSVLSYEEDLNNPDRIIKISGKILDAETGKVVKNNLDYSIFNRQRTEYGITIDLSTIDSHTEDIELVIEGVQLLSKEKEYITLDPANKTIDPEVESIELTKFLTGYKTMMIFKVKTLDSSAFSPFDIKYETGSGEIGNTPFPSLQNQGEYFNVSYVFEEDIQDTIIFRRNGMEMPIRKLKEPIRIRIEIPKTYNPIP